jgi:hypothetical protein
MEMQAILRAHPLVRLMGYAPDSTETSYVNMGSAVTVFI